MLKTSSVSRNKYFEIEELTFPDLKSTQVDGKRYYETPTGEKYPSVTTVLSSYEDKKWLHEWRNRVGEEVANKIVRRSTTRGTRLHLVCEKYLRNDESFAESKSPLVVSMFKSIQKYLDSIDVVYGNEVAAYSHILKTAGRIDCVCSIGGKPLILDFKTATKTKNEQHIQNYFYQATTYAMMVEELIGIVVPKIAILIAVENDKPQLFVKNTHEYVDKVKEIFYNYHAR